METQAFAVAQATRLLERLAFQINATVHSPSADSVHDLRVAIRRFSQVLTVCKSSFESRETRKLRRRLKLNLALAGDVRDCDVAIKLLSRSERKGVVALEAQLSARRKSSEKLLLGSLKDWAAHRPVSKWRGAMQNGGLSKRPQHHTVEETARRKLRRLAHLFFREGERAARPDVSGDELHHLRIATKKLRYTLELFAGVYGANAKRWLEQMQSVQTLLGSINDCRAARRLIADLGGGSEFDTMLKRRQRRKTREFREAWEKDFGAGGAARSWVQALGHARRKPMARSATPRQHHVAEMKA